MYEYYEQTWINNSLFINYYESKSYLLVHYIKISELTNNQLKCSRIELHCKALLEPGMLD